MRVAPIDGCHRAALMGEGPLQAQQSDLAGWTVSPAQGPLKTGVVAQQPDPPMQCSKPNPGPSYWLGCPGPAVHCCHPSPTTAAVAASTLRWRCSWSSSTRSRAAVLGASSSRCLPSPADTCSATPAASGLLTFAAAECSGYKADSSALARHAASGQLARSAWQRQASWHYQHGSVRPAGIISTAASDQQG